MLRFLFALYLVVLILSGFNLKYPRLEDLKVLIPGAAVVAVVLWLLKDA